MSNESINLEDYLVFPQRNEEKVMIPKKDKITHVHQNGKENYKIWFENNGGVMAYCTFDELLSIFEISPPKSFYETQRKLEEIKEMNELTFLETKLIK